MKKNKVTLTKSGDAYICKYVLDTTDIIDTKVDMGTTGKFPQIIPHTLEEQNGQREFVYQIGRRVPLGEFIRKEFNKDQMLTLLYHILAGLESFGMNMISLSYVAKDIQYVFVDPETSDVSFLVAAVDKGTTDLNEMREMIKAVIADASYFEMDRDNYVAKLLTFANRKGTFSVGDMKKYVYDMLMSMGIDIEDRKKKTEHAASGKVSRVGVMQNNAKMQYPQGAPVPMGPNGQPAPMQGRPVPMGPNGQPVPMQGRPVPMGPNGQPAPMQGRPVPMGPNGQPVPMGPNGQPAPMQGRPAPMGPNGQPIPAGRPMPMPTPQPKPEEMQKAEKTPKTETAPKTVEASAPTPIPTPTPMPTPQPKPETPRTEETQEAPIPRPYLLRVATNEKIYIDKPEFLIGRSATKADYTITNNSDVSRIHCVIERRNGVSYIKDNQSTNGTFVNGENIAEKENVFLTNHAKVSMGNEEFIYFIS